MHRIVCYITKRFRFGFVVVFFFIFVYVIINGLYSNGKLGKLIYTKKKVTKDWVESRMEKKRGRSKDLHDSDLAKMFVQS